MGYFAVTHDLEIDTVYLGRQDAAGVAYLRERALAALATGDFDTGTIYLLDQPSAHAAMRFVRPQRPLDRSSTSASFLPAMVPASVASWGFPRRCRSEAGLRRSLRRPLDRTHRRGPIWSKHGRMLWVNSQR